MKKIVTRLTILTIVLISLFGCKHTPRPEETNDSDVHSLNLTENALWDNPVQNEGDMKDFFKMVSADLGESYQKYVEKSEAGKATLEDMQKMYDTLSSSKSPFAGYARIKVLNNILISTPIEKFSVEFITQCLNQAYEIAEGDAPVSQSVFFNFWDNCMVGYSNLGAYDSIFQESQKMLEICYNQDIQMGLMFSYKSLAGNLQDYGDYNTALVEYEKAGNIAKTMFPTLISKDWDTTDAMQRNIDRSDYILCYLDMLSSQLYCSMMAEKYDWIKKNETYIDQIIQGTGKHPSVQLFMLYNMAQYYDTMGNDTLFHKYLAQANEYKPNPDPAHATYIDMEAISWYNYTMALHELKHNNPARALDYMNKIPKDWLTVQDNEIFADIYSRLGRHEEAKEQLQIVVKHNKKTMNGRNRITLSSMSTMIGEKKKDMQMLQMKIDEQHTHLKYRGVIMILALILVVVLAFFLYRQSQLIKKLDKARKKADAANEAKNIFLKNMTHEIHTPIHQIYGFAQLITDRSIPYNEEDIRGMCDIICESSTHLTKIADNIIEVVDKVSELDGLSNMESVMK